MRELSRHLAKPLCLLLIVSFMLLDLNVQSARAGLIGTETILNVQADESTRARVAAFLQRQDVETALAAKGISPAEARKRVASLSDAEVIRVAEAIDRLPAGGDAAGVLGAILFVLVVLVITDIIGVTNIFPFVRPTR
jgi:hypothetical protein